MAKLSICLWLLFLAVGSCCLASRDQPQQNQCQLERLEALEPDNVIKSEAGWIETWNPNHRQFRCANVALARFILEQHALRMPSYSNSPQLIFIRTGRGFYEMVLPGCANTYEEAQESESGQTWRARDGHQKIRRFRAGDVITVPAGISLWMYNSGKENVEAIHLLDTGSDHNQLDGTPIRFYLAGRQQQEFLQYQEGRQQGEGGHGPWEIPRSRREGQQGQGQEQEEQGGNVISGFARDLLTRALNTDNETAGQLQGVKDQRLGGIIRVEDGLHFFAPPSRRQQDPQKQEEKEDQEQGGRRQQQERGREGERGSDNGLQETFCSLRLQQNIGKSTSPDMYHPLAGSLRTLNSYDLPVLRLIKLSAEFGSLHNDALYVPHYNLNAHSIIYALEGRAHVQIVDCSGKLVYDEELREGQALVVPQNYGVTIRSRSQHFLWVAFKTHHKAMISTLAEQIQAWPEQVVAQIYQLREDQARQLKNESPLQYLVPPPQSQRAVA